MIWKRLKKSTPEKEAEFADRMEEAKVTWKDRFAMIVSAFLVIFLPCTLILCALGLLILWMFGAL